MKQTESLLKSLQVEKKDIIGVTKGARIVNVSDSLVLYIYIPGALTKEFVNVL